MGRENNQAGGWIVVGGGIVALLIIFFVFGDQLSPSPESQARMKDRAAIDFCESEYDRIKEDPRMSRGALGIAYGACEQMKADYRRKWNREP